MYDAKEMVAGLDTTATNVDASLDSIGRTRKIETILRLFVTGASLNRFQAEQHNDHCLHSTVATLQSLGVLIARAWESVPCCAGRARVRCKRYWLDPDANNQRMARVLLDRWRPTR